MINTKEAQIDLGSYTRVSIPLAITKNWLTTMIIGWFYFAITNAFILYSMKYDNLTHEQFVYEIAKSLI